jgi:hypothetical protein
MSLLDELTRLLVLAVRATPYANELAVALESPKIDPVVTLIQQIAGEPDVVHEHSPMHAGTAAEPHSDRSVDNSRKVKRPPM